MTENSKQLDDFMKSQVNEAQTYVKELHARIDFDHPEDGLVTLEEVMEIYADDIQKYQDVPDEDIRSTAFMFGACYGELLLKQRLAEVGYAWTSDNTKPVPYLSHPKSLGICSPIERCYDRLIHGRQDDLISYFYNVLFHVNEQFSD